MKRRRRRLIAGLLRRIADRIYPEPLHTLQIMTAEQTRTFMDCREQLYL